MIASKADYKYFLDADKIAISSQPLKRTLFFKHKIWEFQKALRTAEYHHNCGKKGFGSLKTRYDLRNLSMQLGFTIPINVFDAGLSIAHQGTIVVHPRARVGRNCRIHQGVTIGSGREDGEALVPVLSDNVWIGPNAVIVGKITIAQGVAIGANSYVDKSVFEQNITVAGCPAEKVSNKGSLGLWKRATEILDAQLASSTGLM